MHDRPLIYWDDGFCRRRAVAQFTVWFLRVVVFPHNTGDARCLEVSPGGRGQDQLIEGSIRYDALEPFVLLLKRLKFLKLSSPHFTVLLTSTIKGVFCDPNFPGRINTRHSLIDNSFNLSQLRDNFCRFVALVRHP